jgi:hypothetical protein
MQRSKQSSSNNKTQGRNPSHRARSNTKPVQTEFGLLVLVGADADPKGLWDFMSEFGYETVGPETFKGKLDERQLSEGQEHVMAFSIVRHMHIDLALLKEEWNSFRCVGTPEDRNLIYIELSPQSRNSDCSVKLGKVDHLA